MKKTIMKSFCHLNGKITLENGSADPLLPNADGSTMFIKEVARCGCYKDSNGEETELTPEMFDGLVNRFKTSIGKVPVPLTHEGFYNPMMNTGWVTDVWRNGDLLMAKLKITEPDVAQKMKNGTIQDDSVAIMSDDDGCYLEHICLTLNPGIMGLDVPKPVAFEGPKIQAFMFEKAITTETKKINESEVKPMDAEKKIELEKAEAERVALLEKERDNFKAEFEKMTKAVADRDAKIIEFENAKVTSDVASMISSGKITPAQEESAKNLMKSPARADFEKFISMNVVVPKLPDNVIEAKGNDEKVREYSAKDIKAMKSKAEYEKFLNEIATGKAKMI